MEICVGREVYARYPLNGKDQWLHGVVVDMSEDGLATMLLELPKGISMDTALAVVTKSGTVSALAVRGDSSLVKTKRPSSFTGAASMTAREALLSFEGIEEERFMSLSSEDDNLGLEELKRELMATRKQLAASQLKLKKGQRRVSVVEEEDDEEDAEEEEDGDDDDILKLAAKLQRPWTGSASEPRPSQRNSQPSTSAPSCSLGAAMSGGALDQNTLQLLLWKQIMGQLKDLKKKRSDESDSDEDEDGKTTKVSRSLKAYHLMKSQVLKKPRKIVQDYMEMVKQELGAQDGQPVSLRDFSRKINWNKHKTLQNMWEMHVAVIDLLNQDKPASAKAQCIQNLKAIHQTVLEDGNWRHSWLLSGLTDPSRPRNFGGSEQELEVVCAYVKDLEEIQKKTRTSDQRSVDPA